MRRLLDSRVIVTGFNVILGQWSLQILAFGRICTASRPVKMPLKRCWSSIVETGRHLRPPMTTRMKDLELLILRSSGHAFSEVVATPTRIISG
jgi:hypothetical protein